MSLCAEGSTAKTLPDPHPLIWEGVLQLGWEEPVKMGQVREGETGEVVGGRQLSRGERGRPWGTMAWSWTGRQSQGGSGWRGLRGRGFG